MVANSGGPAPRPGRALVDGWYRWYLPEHRSFGDVVNRWPARLRPLVWRYGALRTVMLVVAGRRHHAIAAIRRDAGWRSLLLLSALLRSSPTLIVLHFIDNPLRRPGARGLIDRVWRPVERWALRRAMLRCQVLTEWEAERYSQEYRIDRARFHFVPFAGRHPELGTPADYPPASSRSGVLAAGRVSCDWGTLFAAARGEAWPLTVVCSAAHRPLVDALNRSGRAVVLTDLPEPEVLELLRRSAISVIATYEGGMSQGHVRLCASVDAGTPIIASRTRSLNGYVEDGRTAVLVEPGDSDALRTAINRLLPDGAARDELARAAWERAERWTWPDYLAALSRLLEPDAQAASAASSPSGDPSEPVWSSRREITLDTPSEPIDTP